MTQLLQLFILLPLLGFVISLFIPGKMEDLISWAAFVSVGLHLLGAIAFLVFWLIHQHPTLNIKDIVIYQTPDYSFFLDFYFDKITATYLIVGALLAGWESLP